MDYDELDPCALDAFEEAQQQHKQNKALLRSATAFTTNPENLEEES